MRSHMNYSLNLLEAGVVNFEIRVYLGNTGDDKWISTICWTTRTASLGISIDMGISNRISRPNIKTKR